jgi:hypothetical protein
MTCASQFDWLAVFTVGLLAALVLALFIIGFLVRRPVDNSVGSVWIDGRLAKIFPGPGR